MKTKNYPKAEMQSQCKNWWLSRDNNSVTMALESPLDCIPAGPPTLSFQTWKRPRGIRRAPGGLGKKWRPRAASGEASCFSGRKGGRGAPPLPRPGLSYGKGVGRLLEMVL